MIETVANASGEIVSLGEAKRKLGVWDDSDDAYVETHLKAARAYCEEWMETTLRLSATRTVQSDCWPLGGWVLKHPPVTAVTGITYYDSNNQSQTLSTSLYRTHLTMAGFAVVEWADEASGFVRPALTERDDAVTVTYTAGWGTADNAPADLKAAVLLTLEHLFGEGETKDLGYARAAAMRLLAGRAAPTYA